MIGIETNNGFLDYCKTDFNCPICKKQYTDSNEFYFNRINRNKNGITKVKCSCKKTFKLTYNYKSEAVSFI